MVAVKLLDVPVMVTVAVPFFAVGLAVKIMALLDVAGFGLKEAETPLGNPEALIATLPEKPFTGVKGAAWT